MTTDLVKSEPLALLGEHFIIHPAGIEITNTPTQQEYTLAFQRIRTIDGATAWWYGDLANAREKDYGSLKKLATRLGLKFQYLADCQWVAQQYTLSCRQETLSFEHHRIIASLEDRLQWLQQAINNKWSARQLENEVKRHQQEQRQQEQSSYAKQADVAYKSNEEASAQAPQQEAEQEETQAETRQTEEHKTEQPTPTQTDTRAKRTVGTWWKLGAHRLYEGDSSLPEFYDELPDNIPFAFADPPYNASSAQWDMNFSWSHDWLVDKASIVAVTPGISSIFNFARRTEMPYRWSMGCWITNGMTRGELGFGNWIYVCLFSTDSIHRNAQDIIKFPVPEDFFKTTILTGESAETSHKGRKPSRFMVHLLELFTKEGEYVVDPFLGSGTTLLVAEAMKRKCIGAEINPQFCADIIARWERLTQQKAERLEK